MQGAGNSARCQAPPHQATACVDQWSGRAVPGHDPDTLADDAERLLRADVPHRVYEEVRVVQFVPRPRCGHVQVFDIVREYSVLSSAVDCATDSRL